MKVLGILLCVFSLSSCAVAKTYETKDYGERHAKGLNKSPRHILAALKHKNFRQSEINVPGSVDLSKEVSPPENQGTCGCCWAFALTKALRSEYMLAAKDPGTLEFNYLINNCGPGPKMDGCNGGDFTAARSFEDNSGPGINSLDPFTGHRGHCKHLPVKATVSSYSMVGDANGPTFQDLAYAVGVEHHVLAVDVAAGAGDWENYSGGVYNSCSGTSADIDHMVNMVGYDCQTSVNKDGFCQFDEKGRPVNGDGILLLMNNWGTSWGINGYMKTVMYGSDGNKCNAVATDALLFELN